MLQEILQQVVQKHDLVKVAWHGYGATSLPSTSLAIHPLSPTGRGTCTYDARDHLGGVFQ